MQPDWERANFKNAQDYATALATLYETIGMLQNSWGYELKKIRIFPGSESSWAYWFKDQINFGMKGLADPWYTRYKEYPRVRYLLGEINLWHKNGARALASHEFAHVIVEITNLSKKEISHGKAFHEVYSLMLDQTCA